jgi:tyrosine-specific transport protein
MGKKRFWEAVATLTGTTIGAGVLGIPFVVSKAGFLVGMVEIVVLGLAIILLNLLLGEIVLRTKEDHQLTGYAEKYLGKAGKRIMACTMIFGIYGSLTAYLIGVSNELVKLFPITNNIVYGIAYFFVVALLIYSGLKAIENSELFLGIILFIIILVMSALAISSPSFSIKPSFSLSKNIIYPYGVIFFAYLGAVAIPEMKEELRKQKKDLKKAIILGGFIVMFAYLLFSTAIIGVCKDVKEEVASGCLKVLGFKMELFGILFGIFAMSTSFLALGLALKEMYEYDYKLKKGTAWVLTCIVPLVIFLLGIGSFIQILSIAGALVGGMEGLLIVLMFRNAKKRGERRPEYVIKENKVLLIMLSALFILGITYQVLKTFNII